MRSKLTRLACGVATGTIILTSGIASAQQGLQSQLGVQSMGSDASLGAAYMPGKASLSDTGGAKLSESAVLHVGIGAEAGYDSNVFFQQRNPVSSPIIRIIPFAELTNGARGGAQPAGVFYDLSATLLYREFLTDNTNAKKQRAFNPLISGLLDLNPQSPLNFTLTDQFARFEEPPYGEGQGNITRLYNVGSAQLKYVPGGGRIQVLLRYTNALTYFETPGLKYANNDGHDVTLDTSWRWLPKTSLFLQISQGYVDYFGSQEGARSKRVNSYPLRVIAGLRGLITNKTNIYLGVGYLNGFYSGSAVNTSGLSNLGVVSELSYAPTVLTKLMIGYRHEFRNSPVIGNFYNVDAVYASIAINLASRFVVSGFGRYEYRRYQGIAIDSGLPPNRKDNVIQAGTQADYFIAHWFYIGASYIATINDSNVDSPGVVGLNYTKHLILGRIGVTY